jgi:hypothetical protein
MSFTVNKYWHLLKRGEKTMQLCPVSFAVGCAKCPIVKVCPLKGVIGDDKKKPEGEKEKK